jgi:hypothetical protein
VLPDDEALLRASSISSRLVCRYLSARSPRTSATRWSVLPDLASNPRSRVRAPRFSFRNLMVSTPNPGVLDFQDAVYGPITYDLVSLLRDAYIAWDEERQIDWRPLLGAGSRPAGRPTSRLLARFRVDGRSVTSRCSASSRGSRMRRRRRTCRTCRSSREYLRSACGRYTQLARRPRAARRARGSRADFLVSPHVLAQMRTAMILAAGRASGSPADRLVQKPLLRRRQAVIVWQIERRRRATTTRHQRGAPRVALVAALGDRSAHVQFAWC